MSAPQPALARASRLTVPMLFIATLFAITLAGCAKDRAPGSAALSGQAAATRLLGPDPTHGMAPGPDLEQRSGRGPYPLAIGNRWEYLNRVTTTLTTDAGVQPPVSLEAPWRVVISDELVLDGRRYFVQEESDPSLSPPDPAALYYERQDRTGLYERDLPAAAATSGRVVEITGSLGRQLIASVERTAAAAPHRDAYRRAALELAQRMEGMLRPALTMHSHPRDPAPPAGEIAMLRYPLHVGASWIVRDSPRFTRHVTGRERLEVPAGRFPAWRITGDSELFGPNDRVKFWYGAQGLLRIQAHGEGMAVDDAGNVIGTVIVDADQVLTGVELHDRSRIDDDLAEQADEK